MNLGRPIVTNGAFAMHSSQIILRTCYVVLVGCAAFVDADVIDKLLVLCVDVRYFAVSKLSVFNTMWFSA